MKVSVYGAGNQELYVKKLKLHKKFGGEPPFGGARIAMELASAGHDVVLAEPNRNVMDDDLWKKVENSGVKVVDDDIEGAKHGEIHILFTPFGKLTINIANNIIKYVPKDSVICNTCTISPRILYYNLEKILRFDRKDVGISSFHPAGVPGTLKHKHYVITHKTLNNTELATEEQVNKLVELAESCKKKAYIVPAELVSPIADMGVLVTSMALVGILSYYTVGRRVINAPKRMIERQIIASLETLSAIIETSGVEGLLKVIDRDLVIKSAESMFLLKEQKNLKLALNILNNLNIEEELYKNAKINETTPVSSQKLIKELKKMLGEKSAEGIIKRAFRKLYEY